jgi:hypothetical protein
VRRTLQRPRAAAVAHDVLDLVGTVAETPQRGRDGLVDDLEVTAASELLVLHEREVGLDAGRVAVHDQTDGAGGREDGRLGVAEAVLLAERERLVPRLARRLDEVVGRVALVEADRQDAQPVVLVRLRVVGRTAVVVDHAEHLVAIALEGGECARLGRQLGARRVARPGQNCRDRAAGGAAAVGIVGDARHHQVGAEVGKAQAERPVLVAPARDLLARELRHDDGGFQCQCPEPACVPERFHVEMRRLGIGEAHQVERCQVARGVVQEHVLAARVGGVDAPVRGAGVPLVDRGVVLQARIGARPCRVRDLVP